MKNTDLFLKVQKYKKIMIFGAGYIGLYLADLINRNFNVELQICDNSEKIRNSVSRYEVKSVESSLDNDALYILTSSYYEKDMRIQLNDLGIKDENIILGVTDEANEELKNEKRKQKTIPRKSIQFEVDIASHCNLNCKGCSQFSCIADEEFVDVDLLEKDFKRLGEIFSNICERIYLIGGEPLLHSQIIDCIKIARKYFPIGKIHIYTNGLLLKQQSEIFWNSCRENKIGIIVTKYPINADYTEMEKLCKDNGVSISIIGDSRRDKVMTSIGLDLQGKQDKEWSFRNCYEANECIKLKDGKLYTCTRPVAIYKFNKYFNQKLQVCEEDFIDIYEQCDAESILQKLATPIEFCRYCDVCKEKMNMVWGQTEKDIKEWL